MAYSSATLQFVNQSRHTITGAFNETTAVVDHRSAFIYILAFLSILYLFTSRIDAGRKDGLPTVNRLFPFEPELFSRIRWGLGAKKILAKAQSKYPDQPYRLARGDMDVIVLPASFIPELNHLPPSVLTTREFHAHTLLGHITGIDIVKRTGFHVRILLNRISPAINKVLHPIAHRMSAAIARNMTQDTEEWSTIRPLDMYVKFVSEGVAYVLFGPPICDNPDMVRLCHHHTENIFTIVFIMRFVPAWLQSTLVWLLPYKWSLNRSWKTIEKTVVAEVRRRAREGDDHDAEDAISWMVRDGKTDFERDPGSLSRLIGALAGGSTYSTAGLVAGTVADLVARPELLEEIRTEIRRKHEQVGGAWDKAAFNDLPKLDSVLKESARVAPSSIVIYSRHMEADHRLSNGLLLRKGQKITVNAQITSMDPKDYPDPEEFDGLRHMGAQPFRRVDDHLLTWGSGRWACPGRFVANIMAKILLVELLHDYEFQFIDGKRPGSLALHEFMLIDPFSKIKVRRRKEVLGLRYEG
ncbi:putative cytochrome P450 [Poronia punctata]|nr:putative cytochrome P450 [Poronia punctata]